MATLAALVQALPAELYDDILELTMTTEEVVKIDEGYKPPAQMQISSATRNSVKQNYYRNTTFYVDYTDVLDWLNSIEAVDRKLVRSVMLDCEEFNTAKYKTSKRKHQLRCSLDKLRDLRVASFGLTQDMGDVFRIKTYKEGGEVWMTAKEAKTEEGSYYARSYFIAPSMVSTQSRLGFSLGFSFTSRRIN